MRLMVFRQTDEAFCARVGTHNEFERGRNRVKHTQLLATMKKTSISIKNALQWINKYSNDVDPLI